MRVLVTGANGYLGQGVVKQLLDDDQDVLAVDFAADHIDPRAIKEADHVISILGETRDACSFEEAIRGENGMVRKNVTNSYKDNPYNRKAA